MVPGSHLWDHSLEDHDPADVRTAGAVAPAGTAMVVEGRTWHQAGANRSDHRRHVLLNNFCRAWVRQQENPFLGLAPDVEAALSPEMRKLLGFKTWGTLGHVVEDAAIDADGFVSLAGDVHDPHGVISPLERRRSGIVPGPAPTAAR